VSGFVAVTPYGRGAGSSRVRVYGWLDRVCPQATVFGYLDASSASGLARRPAAALAAEVRLRLLRADHLLLHREASPLSRGRVEGRLLRSAVFSAYDLDDALQWDRRHRVFSKVATCRAAVRAADRVIAGNEVLASWAGSRARDVVVIPSCVEPAEYVVKDRYGVGDPPRLVWIGSPATEPFLTLVAGPLLELHRGLGARLTVLSRGAAPLGVLEVMVDRLPWHTPGALAGADVGIGPLDNSPYSRGKCAYKLLQYAASGLPMVATPVGANGTALARLGGTPAVTAQEWYNAILALLTASTVDRAAIGRSAVDAVRAHYSYQAWEPAWRKAVELP
jgi:hypothetical protein